MICYMDKDRMPCEVQNFVHVARISEESSRGKVPVELRGYVIVEDHYGNNVIYTHFDFTETLIENCREEGRWTLSMETLKRAFEYHLRNQLDDETTSFLFDHELRYHVDVIVEPWLDEDGVFVINVGLTQKVSHHYPYDEHPEGYTVLTRGIRNSDYYVNTAWDFINTHNR